VNLASITSESLSKELEIEVTPIHIIIAKHEIMGTDDDSLCEMIGVSHDDLVEFKKDPIYDSVRTHIGAMVAESKATRTYGWDGIESRALEKLAKRLEYENDSDFLLKVAALSNKAVRREGRDMGVLDPSRNNRTTIVLTERLVQRFKGHSEERVRELSIHDGSMERVSFDEVNSMLEVRNATPIPQAKRITTRDPTAKELFGDMDL
jgi:hypothetical protein